MNKEIRDNILKGLAESAKEGEAMRDLIQEKIDELSDIMSIRAGETELVGRQFAIKKLKEIKNKITVKKTEKIKRGKSEYE